ncbi:MAG: RNA polymerase sigma factor [Gammaproteobacteria bacterium]|nr:RNA polymerase sigma factor [Gammaproteobacteria bacterium]
MSDADLLANMLNKRDPGFAELYDRYGDSIYRYALMMLGSVTGAEEVTQETFVHVIENADRFDPARSNTSLGWLYGIARNRIRILRLYNSRLAPMIDAQSNKESPDRLLGWSKVAEETANAILCLPTEQREVMVLCGLQEIDYATAADILDLPIGTVRSRLSRARTSLRGSLSNIGYSLEDLKHEAQ